MKAIILAGGQGTRFWPVSRRSLPKQFLNIAGSGTMIQETIGRLSPFLPLEDIYVVCTSPYAGEVREQLPLLAEDHIIIEPLARNTAPCIGLAAMVLKARYPDEIMAVLPADHVIGRVKEFQETLRRAEELAREDWLVTFGIEPSYPATGYGYLQRGGKISSPSGIAAYEVECFTEKPDTQTAEAFVASGRFYWNSGMFVWSVKTILNRIARHMPALYEGLIQIEKARSDQERLQVFSSLDRISIDYGIMEKAERVALLPCDLGWSDVGGWQAVADLKPLDAHGISSNTPYIARASRDCIIHAPDGKLVALLGVQDVMVIDTPDALLVCSRERAEEVRAMVEELERRNLDEYI